MRLSPSQNFPEHSANATIPHLGWTIFDTAPSMVARHASRFLQSLVELECGAISLEAQSGCPRLQGW